MSRDQDLNLPKSAERNRRMTLRFLRLPFRLQMEVVHALDVLTDEELELEDISMFLTLFEKATAQRRLEQLWDEIESRYEDPAPNNPFRDFPY